MSTQQQPPNKVTITHKASGMTSTTEITVTLESPGMEMDALIDKAKTCVADQLKIERP